MSQLSVFIIGPMGHSDQELKHTDEIAAGARMALAKAGLDESEYEVMIPDRLSGSAIVDDVFHQIDTADFAIADISNRSPNVFYEVAYFNTLGTPMVILDLKQGADTFEAPFYWKQSRIYELERMQRDEVAAVLEDVCKNYLTHEVPVDLSSNPISQFYSVPLVDISASSGLAVGYYSNFLQHVLMNRLGALAMSDELDRLIVVRPQSIRSFQDDEDALAELFPDARELKAESPSHPRGGVFLNRVNGREIIDLPTPLYSLQQAPRYRKLLERTHHFQRVAPEVSEAMLLKLEQKLIDAFFRTIAFLQRQYSDLAWKRMEIKTLQELQDSRMSK